jgi:hypothetical protein
MMVANKEELFFPCLESPLRFYLASVAQGRRLSWSSKSNQAEVVSLFQGGQLSSASLTDEGEAVSLCENRTEWEEWRLVPHPETGSFKIQSVHRKNFLLTGSAGGVVSTSKANDESVHQCNQLWDLEQASSSSTTTTSTGIQRSNNDGIYVQLASRANGQRLSCTKYGYISLSNKDQDLDDEGGHSCSWRMELLTGELCFLSNPHVDRRLRCDVFGNVSLDSNWNGWEVWRFIEVGNSELILSSWTHDSKVLASDASGKIYTIAEENRHRNRDCRWTVAKGRNGVVLHSVAHGKYLCATLPNDFYTVDNIATEGVEWHLEPANSSVFFLSVGETQLSGRDGGLPVTTTSNQTDLEEWKIEPYYNQGGGNRFSIFSCKDKRFLGSAKDGRVWTTSDPKDSAIVWELEGAPDGGYFVFSLLHERYLHFGDDSTNGSLPPSTSVEKEQSWMLCPRMPGSISGGHIAAFSGASVTAAALMVAAPFAAVWGIPLVSYFYANRKKVSEFNINYQEEDELVVRGGQSPNRPLIAWRSW